MDDEHPHSAIGLGKKERQATDPCSHTKGSILDGSVHKTLQKRQNYRERKQISCSQESGEKGEVELQRGMREI
jgi:hypothetical protein